MKRISKNRLTEFIESIANTVKSDMPGIDSDVYVSKQDGSYLTHVGLEEDLKYYLKRGITEQFHSPNGSCACVAFNPEEQKWYGWSHRAIYGFTIGSECKKGKCHYIPAKGEWTAKTMDDAYQMACDFAEGVS